MKSELSSNDTKHWPPCMALYVAVWHGENGDDPARRNEPRKRDDSLTSRSFRRRDASQARRNLYLQDVVLTDEQGVDGYDSY